LFLLLAGVMSTTPSIDPNENSNLDITRTILRIAQLYFSGDYRNMARAFRANVSHPQLPLGGNHDEEIVKTVHSLDELFNTSERVAMLKFDIGLDPDIVESTSAIIQKLGTEIEAYISAQPDLAGVHSLVRKGLVKSFTLPNGMRVVTKRNNPQKPGRFECEQRNAQAIRMRLNLPNLASSIRLPYLQD
jgi:hypothetical protein